MCCIVGETVTSDVCPLGNSGMNNTLTIVGSSLGAFFVIFALVVTVVVWQRQRHINRLDREVAKSGNNPSIHDQLTQSIPAGDTGQTEESSPAVIIGETGDPFSADAAGGIQDSNQVVSVIPFQDSIPADPFTFSDVDIDVNKQRVNSLSFTSNLPNKTVSPLQYSPTQ